MRNIDQLNINFREPANVSYAKARCAIELDAQEIAKHNVARAANWEKETKELTASILGGKIVDGKRGRYVDFGDNKKAKF